MSDVPGIGGNRIRTPGIDGDPLAVDAEVRVHDARQGEEDLDRSLRPPTLDDFVNQAQVTDQLAIFIEAAKRRGDTAAVRALEALAPYPGPGPLDIGRADAWRARAIRYGALGAGRDNADFYFRAPRLSPEYTAADVRAWSAGSATSSNSTSWLPEARSPAWSQVSAMRTPGACIGTRNRPVRGASSSVRAQAKPQSRAGAPVE